MKTDDLGAFDRSTLWLWRASNLLGWGIVGAVAATATAFVWARLVGGVMNILPAVVGLWLLPYGAAIALSGVVAGTVVGNHVYRSPRLVAALALLLPATGVVLAVANVSWPEALIALAFPAIGALVAAWFAGHRFDKRPRALRATAP
jgi:hypothetical protein